MDAPLTALNHPCPGFALSDVVVDRSLKQTATLWHSHVGDDNVPATTANARAFAWPVAHLFDEQFGGKDCASPSLASPAQPLGWPSNQRLTYRQIAQDQLEQTRAVRETVGDCGAPDQSLNQLDSGCV